MPHKTALPHPGHASFEEGRRREARAAPAFEETRGLSWPAYALVAGALGALFVALTFLVLDIATGRPPLFTPAVLGTEILLAQPAPAPGTFAPAGALGLVAAYTLLHGAVFVAFGWMAASIVLTREPGRRRFSLAGGTLLALLLFAAFEASFLIFAWASNLTLVERLGAGWISFANAGAAAVMAAVLGTAARRREGER